MGEPVEKSKDLKEGTIDLARESNLGSVIDEISQEQGLYSNEDKLAIPIPVDLIEDFKQPPILSQEVKDNMLSYLQKINNPQTASEYPYLITGKISKLGKIELNRSDKLHEEEGNFANDTLKMSSYDKKLVKEIDESKKRGDSVYILGHTHPKPNEETRKKAIAENIPKELKNKHQLKELGLNLSLADLYQLVYFQEGVKGYIPDESKVFISVLTFEGQLHLVGIEDDKFKKVTINLKA
jgi:hypothetical protein